MQPGVMAEFADSHELMRALAHLRARGHHDLDAFTPFPVPGLEELIGLRRTRLPWFVIVLGLCGATAAFLFQLWIQYDYRLDIGGRPLDSLLSFVPISFESGILLAAATTVIGLLALCGLPRLWHPVFELEGFERATIDRFWAVVRAHDHEVEHQRERIADELRSLGALRVVWLEDVA